MESYDLTPEEMEALQNYGGYSAPSPEERHNAHKFLHEVSISKDTTKTGNLDGDELGSPKLPLRTLKEMALFCEKVWQRPFFADYYLRRAEILTSSSLSKNAKLLDLAVVTRKEVADTTKRTKPNKGWFKKKGGNAEE